MTVDRRILTDLVSIERNAREIERCLAEIGERLQANAALLKAYDDKAAASMSTTIQCGVVLRNSQSWGLAAIQRAMTRWEVFGCQVAASAPRLKGTLTDMARTDVQRLTNAVNSVAATFEAPPRDFTPPEAA